MLRIFFTFFFALLPFLAAFAQDGEPTPEEHERIRALQVALITERLNLSQAQAEKFWPVFNTYADRKRGLREQMRDLQKSFRTASDAELKVGLDKILELRTAEVDLDREYQSKFLKVINHRQLAELYAAEHRLKQLIIKELRKRHHKGGHGGRRP